MGLDGINKRPPHPATILQPKGLPPHGATVAQAKPLPPHAATVVQRREVHPATLGPRSPFGVATPVPRIGAPASAVQRAQAPAEAPIKVAVHGQGIRRRTKADIDKRARYVPQARWDFSCNADEVWWTTGMGPCRALGLIGPNGSAFSHLDLDKDSTPVIVSRMAKAVGENPRIILCAGSSHDNGLEKMILECLGKKEDQIIKLGMTPKGATDAALDVGNSTIYQLFDGKLNMTGDDTAAEVCKNYEKHRGEQRSFYGFTMAGSVVTQMSTFA